MASLAPTRPVLDQRTPPTAGMKRVRFHGGPYAGRVEDVPTAMPHVDCIQSSPATARVTMQGLNAPFPSPTVTFSTMRYELTRYSDGSWHAHTPLGMKALRRNAARRQTLLGTIEDTRRHVLAGNQREALIYLSRLADLTCGT